MRSNEPTVAAAAAATAAEEEGYRGAMKATIRVGDDMGVSFAEVVTDTRGFFF